jgi:hypothetical protein
MLRRSRRHCARPDRLLPQTCPGTRLPSGSSAGMPLMKHAPLVSQPRLKGSPAGRPGQELMRLMPMRASLDTGLKQHWSLQESGVRVRRRGSCQSVAGSRAPYEPVSTASQRPGTWPGTSPAQLGGSSDRSDLDEHAGGKVRSHSGSHRLYARELLLVDRVEVPGLRQVGEVHQT